MRREASHQEDGRSSIEFYRPEQHDVMFYDTEHDELAVHADTKRQIQAYLRSFGLLLFGDEDYFPPADKFTLEPLFKAGPDCLLCEDVEGLEKVRFVEYRRAWGGAHQDIESWKSEDVFAGLAAAGRKLGPQGRLVSATFKVKFVGSTKERSVTIRPPRSARYERNEDSEVIERWLACRGFILETDAEVGNAQPIQGVERARRNSGYDHGSTDMEAPAAR
jgi:hypothetical protein